MPPTVASGWRPADDDDSAAAVAWRARTGLRRADRSLSSIAALTASVNRLDASAEKLNTTINLWMGRAGRVFWAFVATGIAAAGAGLWSWISTLHH